MLAMSDKVLLVRLFYENHASVTSTLCDIAHEKGIKRNTALLEENTIRARITRLNQQD
jgi:hypothetical protein